MATSARALSTTPLEVSELLNRLKVPDFSSKEYAEVTRFLLQHASKLEGHQAQKLIDFIDQTLDTVKADADLFQKCLRTLREICGLKGILPSSHMLSDELTKVGDKPTTFAGVADIWDGMYNSGRVSIKAYNISSDNAERIKKRFFKEVVIWKRLSHPNVVPFIGISTVVFPLCMVSEWMPHGNVRDYVLSHTETNRLQLIFDVVKGLHYLHSFRVVHGDLQGANILINGAERACLAYFGYASIVHDPSSVNISKSTSCFHGTMRWMAPELINQDTAHLTDSHPTTQSDIYALAMVFIEVFTGNVPFHECCASAVLLKAIDGIRPERPQGTLELGLSDDIWELVQSCWHKDRDERPTICSVLDTLQRLAPGLSLMERLADFDSTSEESMDILRSALSRLADVEFALRLHGKDAQKFIDTLDQAIDSAQGDPIFVGQCLRILGIISGRISLVPSSYMLPEPPRKIVACKTTPGGFADIWKCKYSDRLVAIKCLRGYSTTDNWKMIRKAFFQEAVIWKRLSHPNIVPFLGVAIKSSQIFLVSEWMTHGKVIDYLKSDPNADRLRLLKDVATGLQYLHSINIIHGNIRGDNVLVDYDGNARICGFGLVSVDCEPWDVLGTTTNIQGSPRWMAPELCDPSIADLHHHQPSQASDVYAFAMTSVEIFSGQVPFHQIVNEIGVIIKVVQGARPQRPEQSSALGLTDNIWTLLEKCWGRNPEERPSMETILSDIVTSKLADASECPPEISIVSLPDLGPVQAPNSPLTGYLSPDSPQDGLFLKSSAASSMTSLSSPENEGFARETTTRFDPDDVPVPDQLHRLYYSILHALFPGDP